MEITRKEWDQIRSRRSSADVGFLFMILQRDGEITIAAPEEAAVTPQSLNAGPLTGSVSERINYVPTT